MKFFKITFSTFILFLMVSSSYALNTAESEWSDLVEIRTGSTGILYIYVEQDEGLVTPNLPNCNKRYRYVLSPSHPAYGVIYASILSASGSKQKVMFMINQDSCLRDSGEVLGIGLKAKP